MRWLLIPPSQSGRVRSAPRGTGEAEGVAAEDRERVWGSDGRDDRRGAIGCCRQHGDCDTGSSGGRQYKPPGACTSHSGLGLAFETSIGWPSTLTNSHFPNWTNCWEIDRPLAGRRVDGVMCTTQSAQGMVGHSCRHDIQVPLKGERSQAHSRVDITASARTPPPAEAGVPLRDRVVPAFHGSRR